jgi:hypothetical protein
VPHNVAPIDGVVTVFTNRSRTDEVKPMLPDGVT